MRRRNFPYSPPYLPKNALGKVTRETDPLGRETRYTYGNNNTPDPDPATGTGHDLLKIEQKNGANYDLLETRTYNSQHRPLTITDAAGQTTTYTYNGQGQLLTMVTPPRGGLTLAQRTTTYSYDTNGYLQTVTGPLPGATTSFTYDGYGRERTVTASDSYTLTVDYDALDRITKRTYPDGTYEEIVYNRLDAEKQRDRLGRWSHTFYDALRRVVSTRDAAGRTTTQQWCTCGSLDKVIDGNNSATTWQRDLQGRVTSEVRADSSATTFVYENTTSRLKQRTDAKNQTTTYQYALDDSRTQVTYTNAQISTPNVTLTYDPVYNRLATMVDGTGTTTYAYHPPGALGAGRVSSVDGPLANDTITYGYDELSQVATRQINGAASTLSVAYDALGRIASETSPLGAFGYTYDGLTQRVATQTYPSGQTATYVYFGNTGDRRLQQLHNRVSGGATLSKFDYTYDAVGNVKTWSQQIDTNPAKVMTFGYDAADQITSAGAAPAGAAPNRFAYAYDGAGNRTAEQLDDVVMGATYNNVNELVSQQAGGALLFRGTVNEPATVTVGGKPAQVGADNTFAGATPVASGTSTVAVVATDPSGNVRTNTYQVSQSGTSKSFAYDLNGNLSSDGTRTLEWDAEDRVIRIRTGADCVSAGTACSEFTYDGTSRRVRIVEKVNGTVTSDRRFLWAGSQLAEERDASGATVSKRFFALGVQEAGASRFYAVDHLGSIRELTDSAGTILARYDHDPWGRRTKLAGTGDADIAFTGHWQHGSSGLLFAPRRAYDPTVGRWISEDPLGYQSDDSNLYRYVRNTPATLVDPTGEAAAAAAAAPLIFSPDPITKVILIVLACGTVIAMVVHMTKKSSKTCFCFDREPTPGVWSGNKYGDCVSEAACDAKCRSKFYAFGRCYDK